MADAQLRANSYLDSDPLEGQEGALGLAGFKY